MQSSHLRRVYGSMQSKHLTGFLCVIVVVQFVCLFKIGVNPVHLADDSAVHSLEAELTGRSGADLQELLAPNLAEAPQNLSASSAMPSAFAPASSAAKPDSRAGGKRAWHPLPPPSDEDTLNQSEREEMESAWKTSICEDMPLDVDEIQIHVLSWKRPQSLSVLLSQLNASDYSGWDSDVPLFIHVDGGADPLVIEVAWEFNWDQGPLHTDIREANVGLREMWLSSMRTAATAAGPNTLMIVLEDDMRVSSIYFQWVLLMIKAYGRNRQCRHESLMGFSLSPVRLMEMRKPFRRWRSKDVFPVSTRFNTAYLSTLPSSWGGSFWSDRWLEFDAFVSERMRPEYYNVSAEAEAKTVQSFQELHLTPEDLYVPDARSNWWPSSWKRFLVDFMYGCGLFMMYPNLKGENALATTLSLQGKHTMHTDSKGERVDDELADDSFVRAPRKMDWQRKPQTAPLIKGDMQLMENLRLPDLSALQMTTLWMEPITVEQAVQTGLEFVAKIAASEFAELGHAWCSSRKTRPLAMVAELAMVADEMV